MNMQLWTHHPSGFQVDDPTLKVDHTKGGFWNHEDKGFRYREVLPELVKIVGTNQFLWCCTLRGEFKRMTEAEDLVEWEVKVDAESLQILAFYSVPGWEDLVWSRGDDWSDLILDSPAMDKDTGALVRVPLNPGTAVCHGQLPVEYPKK